MKKVLHFFCLLLVCYSSKGQELIVNEFSQGPSGSKEYIELLVVGSRTCTDSTADLSGWIIDDENGWYSPGPFTPGHFRFSYSTNWQKVPYGSIILLYNSADKNPSISIGDDPTDANKDLVYVVPDNSVFLERHPNSPTTGSLPSYSYASAPAANYIPGGGQWSNTITFNNTGDVISLVSPANQDWADFSLAYGYGSSQIPGHHGASVMIGNIPAGNHCYLRNRFYLNPTDWTITTIASGRESPGSGNDPGNITWINQMRMTAVTAAPTAISPQSFCSSSNPTITNLSATGNTIQWYNGATSGTALAASTPLVNGNTYYASQTVGGCESSRIPVVVNLNSPAPPTASSPQSFCSSTNPTVANLLATGTFILWYSAASGGTALAPANALVSGNTYYASQTVSGCEGSRTPVVVNVNSPALPTAPSPQSFCSSNSPTIANLGATGTAIQWYSTGTGGTSLATTNALINGNTYWASQTVSGCQSARTPVIVNLNSPASPAATSPQSFCSSANPTVANLAATGTGIQWYNALTGGSVLTTSSALVNGTSYYASQTVSGCESSRTQVVANLNSPSAPTATSPQSFCSSANPTIANLGASGTGIQWYNVATGGTALPNTNALLNGGSYYSSQTVGGCESARTPVVVNLNSPASPTASSPQSFCSSANPTIANLGASGTGIQWYNAATGGTALATTNALANGNTYYASQTVGACESSRTAVVVNVSLSINPGVSIVQTSGGSCSGSPLTFNATPTNGGTSPTYQWLLNGSPIPGQTNTSFTSSSLTTGQQVSVRMTSNDACASPTTVTSNVVTISTSSTVVPSVNINTPAAACSGSSITFNATPTNGGTSPTYQWLLNGSPISGQTAVSFTSSSLTTGQQVSVRMTSNDACASPITVTSNVVTISTSLTVVPSVSINTPSAACSGSSITFSATPANGGTNPLYQWLLNGSPISGQTSASFTSSSLTNGQQVSVRMISNDACASPTTVTSNVVTISNTTVIPSVTINTPSATCSGLITFTATPVNGGSAPTYQWLLNGSPITGQTGASYSATPANGTQVSVRMISNDPCASPATVTSNVVTVNNTGVIVPSVSITPLFVVSCINSPVTFTAWPVNGGTSPTFQWLVNGSAVPGETGLTFTTSTLKNNDAVSFAMTSSDPCASPPNVISNLVFIEITTSAVPSVFITPTEVTTCAGSPVTFTASPINGGSAPVYQWKVNGNNVTGTGNTFTSSTLGNNDLVSVVMTSNASCASTPDATSNVATVFITPGPAAAVSITPGSVTSCSGLPVTFTASPVNGGTAPTYQWLVNGVAVLNQNGSSFTSSTLTNNDAVAVIMTSNISCASTLNATSNTVKVNINNSSATSISITPTSVTSCSGSPVTFTAFPVNGGSAPVYQWKVNGINVPGTTNTFTSSTLNNSDMVSVVMTSNALCASPPNAVSNTVTVILSSSVTAGVSISPATFTACTGSPVTLTASAINGGSAPAYQWKVNGVNVPVTGDVFTSSTLSDNDAVSVVMTSNAPCASSPIATSNVVKVAMTTNVVPAVSIAPPPINSCTGAPITFTASPFNGGTSPAYQWRINGINVAGSGNTFTSSTLNNNDVVSVVMTSSAACASPGIATSNPVTINIIPSVVPAVSINTPGAICSGSPIVFNATPTNGGTPTYQWLINDSAVPGQTGASFTSSTLTPGSQVSVSMTSSVACATPATVTSNVIFVNSIATVTPAVSINTPAAVCSGSPITFTVQPTNSGATPIYQWLINGAPIAGQTGASFTSSTLASGSQVSVTMASSVVCASPATVSSNVVTVSNIAAIIPAVSINTPVAVCNGSPITFNATPVSGGTSPGYQWLLDGSPIAGQTGASFTSSTLISGNQVSVAMTSNAACAPPATVTSNVVVVNNAAAVVPSVSINTPPAVCYGTTVTFNATPVNGGTTPAYQWLLNGSPIAGQTGASFTSSSLNSGSQVRVAMTSNAPCASPATVISNMVTANNSAAVVPSVSINPPTAVCNGSPITFNATPINGGLNPAYQWFLNGSPIAGQTGTSLTSSTFTSGSQVSVNMTSNAPCASPAIVTSNVVSVNNNAAVVPSVSINTPPAVCIGTPITFNATPVNGGTSPTYQWLLNGSPIGGQTGASFTSSTLTSGSQVSVNMTSNAACASPAIVTSNVVSVNNNAAVVPSVSINTPPAVCSGLPITFNATPVNGGASPGYQWLLNGSPIAGQTGTSFTSSTLTSGSQVSVNMTSNAACASPAIVTSNVVSVNNNAAVVPSVSINTPPAVCNGLPMTFNATPVNGGAAPTYQWLLNGSPIAGQTGASFTSSTLITGSQVSVAMTSNAACASQAILTSNVVSINNIVTVVPAVSITPTTVISCVNSPVTFTAAPVNGGSSPNYQWLVNGTAVSGETRPIFSTSSLTNNDVVSVVMTSNITCASTPNATSNTAIVTITSGAAPAVSITPVTVTSCTGSPVTFTASPVNGGTSPTYQWKVNGTNVAGTGNTFTSSTLNNNDAVTVVVTSNASCASTPDATSNTVIVAISAGITPAVSITPSTVNACTGSPVTFIASPINGGSSPAYLWKVNGISVAGTGNTFISSTLKNNDAISVVMTSNASCASTPDATSNAVTVALTASVTPVVTITPLTVTSCTASPVTFTASSVNSGTSPTYQWKVNGTNVAGTNNTFTSSTLNNNDAVTVVMTSNASCASTPDATSNTVIIATSAGITPAVSITPSTVIACTGSPITFTASPVNGGNTPAFQWKVNGTDVTGTGNTFTSSSLASNDVVTVVMTSNASCASTATVTSNPVSVEINNGVTPAVSISPTIVTTCKGSPVTFTAFPVNGGDAPTFQWKVNGINITATGSTFTSSSLNDNDVVSVSMTSNALCALVTTATSNAVPVAVTSGAAPAVNITPLTAASCIGSSITFTASPINGGNAPSYQWKVNGTVVAATGNVFTSSTLNNNDVISVVMTSNASCASTPNATSNDVVVNITSPAIPSTTVLQPTCLIALGTITISSPAAGYTYSVDGNNYQTTLAFNNLAPGTYSVTAKINGCISGNTPVIVNPAPATSPAPAASVAQQPTCTTPTGSIIVTTPTPDGIITYSLDGLNYDNTTGVFINLNPGFYDLTYKDATGCKSGSVNLQVNSAPGAPGVPTITVTQPTCAVQTGSITVTSTTTGLQFSLDGGAFTGYPVGGYLNIMSGLHTLSVQNISGCTTTTNISVASAPAPLTPPAVTVVNPTCANPTGSIVVTTPLTGMEYSLDGAPFGPYPASGYQNVASGLHTLRATNTGGCIALVNVSIGAAPGAPATPQYSITQPTCAKLTATIEITSATNGLQFSLDGSLFGNYPTGGYMNVAGGPHTLTTQNSGGCSTTINITVTAAPGAPAIPTYSVTDPTCTTPTGSILISSSTTGFEFSIDGGPFVNYPPAGFSSLASGTHSLTVRNISGCTTTTNIDVAPAPAPPISPVFTIIQPTCAMPTGTIVITTPAGAGFTYSIDGTSYQSSATFGGLPSAIYNVTVQSNGCISSPVVATIVQSNSTLSATASAPVILCNQSSGVITITASNGTAPYTFSINGGAFQASNVFTGLAAGQHNVIIKDAKGCTANVTTTLIKQATNAVSQTFTLAGCKAVTYKNITHTTSTFVNDTLRTITGCDSVYVVANIDVQNVPAVTRALTFNGCDSLRFNNITYKSSTIVRDTIKSVLGCDSIYTVNNINVNTFSLGLTASVNPAFEGERVLLSTISTTTYQTASWSPSNLFATQNSATQSITADSSRLITVIAASTAGCIDTARLLLEVKRTNDFFVPNAFSPNNDGRNDLFLPMGTTISNGRFRVFNQWGALLFETENIKQGWDGNYKGKQQPVGVYIYDVKVTLLSGTVILRKGSVNLIR